MWISVFFAYFDFFDWFGVFFFCYLVEEKKIDWVKREKINISFIIDFNKKIKKKIGSTDSVIRGLHKRIFFWITIYGYIFV